MKNRLDDILAKALEEKDVLEHDELKHLLTCEEPGELAALYRAAYRMKERHIGRKVSLRGLVEMSDLCVKDCYYCGIRRSNRAVPRFAMTRDEILRAVRLAREYGYSSIVLQSGERSDPAFVDFVEEIVREIKRIDDFGITLSCGEQSSETYRRWFAAGAHRYLLRIESSSRTLYRTLHPDDAMHDWETRRRCLDFIRDAGFQLGTGVMIALPRQTADDLASDLEFFREVDADMIGMGPYLPHHQTPLGREFPELDAEKTLETGLKMIAAARLYLRDVNIAATTALQTLSPADGRERGLLAGANVVMPNIGDTAYRRGYQLYENKPDLDENLPEIRRKLEASLQSIGETVAEGWGDSPHFASK